MDRKIRVGAVSYLNTKPLIYGFEKGMMKETVDLLIDYPANIANALLKDEIDIGLVPVAILPRLKEYHIISDYCIAADGEVASVCLFSEVPLEQIKTILLDYQSMTSVLLVQVLMKQFWKIDPEIKNTVKDFGSEIKGTTAGVIIGNRALEQRCISKYVYDLGLAWKQFTGLPFVFAAWVSNKPLPDEFITGFNFTTGIGLGKINNIVAALQYDVYDLHEYYEKNLVYEFTDRLRKGMDEFLKMIQ